MSDQDIVKESLATVARRLGYINTDAITQRDYEHISERISEQTGTLISSSTIKRLLHGQFSRMPQVATLNAIAIQLGHKSWQEYRLSLGPAPVLPEPTQQNTQALAASKPAQSKFRLRSTALTAACLAIIIIIVAGFLRLRPGTKFVETGKAQFSARKATQHDIPATVIFNYNIDEVEGDSFFIQQSWDRNRRVQIYKHKYVLTDIYYEPGYHIAKLIVNDSVIRTIDISIPTSGWFIYAKDSGAGKTPEYITDTLNNSTVSDGSFKIAKSDLDEQHIDITREKAFVYAIFPDTFKVNSDNFTFRTRIRMKELRKNFCPYITVDIFTQRYTMFVNTMPPGCSSELNLQFGDHFVSGKENDLTHFGYDVTQWMDLSIMVVNRNVTVLINQQPAYSTKYSHTSKFITGMALISNGLCEIDEVSLKGSDGEIVYENKFDDDPKPRLAIK